VAEHLPGSRVRGQVDRFSSHGAYVTVGDVRCYLPLKNMGDPAPRRARDVVRQGEERELVVDRIDPDRRGVDVALPGFETLLVSDASKPAPEPQAGVVDTEDYSMAVKKAPSRKRAPAKKKAPAKRKSTARKAPASKKAPAKRKATAGKKAPAKRKSTARKAPARKKAPAKRKATAGKKAPAKRKSTARKAPARKKAPAKRKATAGKKAPARKSPARSSST